MSHPDDTPAPQGLALSRDAWGRLVLELSPTATACRGGSRTRLPDQRPDRWIALCDAEGREIVCLETLDLLAPEARCVRRGGAARASSCR